MEAKQTSTKSSQVLPNGNWLMFVRKVLTAVVAMDAYMCDHRDGSAGASTSSSFSSLPTGGFGLLKVIVFRMVASVVSSSWFCIRKAFVFLVWSVSTLLSRISARISSRRDGRRSLLTEESETERPMLDALAFDEMNDKDFLDDDDRDDSSFKFQFKFNFPEDIRRSMEKQHRTAEVFEVADVTDGPEQSPVDKKVPSETATMTNNYMFVSEKNITEFVVEPEEVTCRYRESFVVEHDDDHLRVSEELDRELRARLFSLKRFNYSDEDVTCNWESISKKSKGFSLPNTADLYYMDDLKGKKGFQLSNDDEIAVTSEFRVEELRGFYQSSSDDGTAATARHVPMDEERSNMVETFSDEMIDEVVTVPNSDESDPVVLLKLEYVGSKKSGAVAMGHEARSVEEKDLSSEKDFDATRSDSNSLTCSGGYSVKSLEPVTANGTESPYPMTVLVTTPDVYKDSEQLDSSQLEDEMMKVSQPVAMNSKVGLVGGGNMPCRSSDEDFYAIASNPYSPTSSYSDGYSVISLEMVTESDDGFLSDRDISRSRCVNLDEASLTSPVGEQQDGELSECFENYDADSVNEFSNELDQFNVGAKEVNQVIQEANFVISRLSSINLPEPELGDFSEIDMHINNLDCTIDDEYPLNHVHSETDNYIFDYKLHEFDGEEEALPENLKVQETLLQRSLSLDEEFTILENGSMSMFMTRNRNSNKIFHKQGSPEQDHGDSLSEEEKEELVASFLSKDDEGKRWHPPGYIGLAKRDLNERKHSDEVESKKVMFTSSEVHSRKCSPEIQSEGVFQSLQKNAKDFHEEGVLEKEDLRFYEEVIPEKRIGLVKRDFDELEAIWDDHQDLIEQLNMELINGKAIALPTILEEPESPGLTEDLKKWNFDVVFLHEQPIDEMHKMYKKYEDGMRKLDILNNQKMHAIDLLHLKDTFQSTSSQKPSITSLLSQSFFPWQRRKSNNGHLEKFINELRNDLEVVYVGQTCLSWEFLTWQFEKSQELPGSDPYRSHQYNRVADEFRNFQVLIQRFVEDEPFHVPRVSYYVKSRRDLCNLLQVPVIQEDCLKDKVELKKNDNKSIMIEELENIMAKSIRTFWQFVKADKEKTSRILKELVGIQAELQEPADLELMVDIQADLRKKEKKLKDILKIGNCLVKKFKKPNEERSSQDLFFSQVDLKLVSRVLEMPRITTDQLVWCYHKLGNITFVDRKVHREPSFFVFPCSA